MTDKGPRANAEQWPSDRPFVSEIPKLRKLVASLNLAGLANDTKWNELIDDMRSRKPDEWYPRYRFNCVDSDYVSQWDGEWWHHLPFPFISVRWFDITFYHEECRGQLLEPELIDHSSEIEALLTKIGFDFEKGQDVFRIFGYSPRDYTNFKRRDV